MNNRGAVHKSGEIDVSVIIVNWNTKELIRNCLESVYQTMGNLAFETIVVDNASSDGSLFLLNENIPQVIKIRNQENRGFGAANNQAFAVMKGKYALLLNTDSVLTPEAVQRLWSFAETRSRAAIICGQLLNAGGKKQNSIAAFPTLLTLAVNISLLEYLFPRHFPSKRYEHKEPIEADSAIGACMLIRKKALDEVGFFDDRYFFFFEETDLAYALKRSNWLVYQVPNAFIYHLQGQSIGHNIRSRIEFFRSRYQFLHKWHSPVYYYLARGIVILRLIIDWLLSFISVTATFGLAKKPKQKFAVYSKLIYWHTKKI